MMAANIRDREFLIFFKVIVNSSYLEIVAQFTKHHSIIDVTSQWLCEEVNIQRLQGLWSISQPETIDEIQHYLLFDLEFTLHDRAEQV